MFEKDIHIFVNIQGDRGFLGVHPQGKLLYFLHLIEIQFLNHN